MRYAVGIDLGTTNSVVAFAPLDPETDARPALFSVPQLVGPGTVEARSMLPSFLYLGTVEEAAAGTLDLPWARARDWVAGALAQRQAAELPARTVAAAKSWLAYPGVDRRAYYVGIETAGPAVPGLPRPLSALCVVPFGMEEGTEADVPGEAIGLVVGEPARFRVFSSPVRKHDRPGDLLRGWAEGELGETDSMEATLPPGANAEQDYVPVRFHSRITELGVFELWCVSTVSDDRWKLEFNVREYAEAA